MIKPNLCKTAHKKGTAIEEVLRLGLCLKKNKQNVDPMKMK